MVHNDVHGESKGVVELEDDIPGDDLVFQLFHVGNGGFQQLHARAQGFQEFFFLVLDHVKDKGGGVLQLRIGFVHDLEDHLHGFVEEGFLQTDGTSVTDGPTHDAAQDVAPAFVGRQDPVGNQEGGGPGMVGNDLHGHFHLVGLAPFLARELAHLVHDGGKEIGVKVGGHILEYGDDPFQAHARVDGGLGKRRHGAVFGAFKLHENQVPQFQPPVAVAAHGAIGSIATEFRAPIDVNFGTGTAGAGVTHGPEVVLFAQAGDAGFRDAHLVLPDVVGFVVVFVDGDVEFFRVKAVAVGEQIPGKFNGLFLEVIPKGKVAQHFKEGMVAGGVAHVFQVVVLAAGPDAFLGRYRSAVIPFFIAGENPFELNHACVDKKQGGIVLGHQGR